MTFISAFQGSPSSQSSPSQARSLRTAASDSRVERSRSVSSILRMNLPPTDLGGCAGRAGDEGNGYFEKKGRLGSV